MPKTVGAQRNPMLGARRSSQSERRLRDRARRELGNVLYRQALVGDAPARPHQGEAPRRDGRGALRRSARQRRDRAHARNADRAKGEILRPHGRAEHVRASRPCGVLPRHRDRRAHARPRAPEPARRRRHMGGDQSRAHLRRLLLPRARELRRRRGLALRPRRRASARTAAIRAAARLQALRFHHRRRALQARLVRDRAAAVRPLRRRDLARPARRRAGARLAARQARDQAFGAAVERGGARALDCRGAAQGQSRTSRASRPSSHCGGTRPRACAGPQSALSQNRTLPSSSGPGRRPLTAKTGVRVP